MDERLDRMGLPDNRGGSKNLANLLSCFQLPDRYRLDFQNAPIWTWTNRIGSSRSNLDRLFVRLLDRSNISCPRFKVAGYTDHKSVICMADIDKIH